MDKSYLTVGTIVNTHGLKGDLKVLSRTDFPETRFAPGSLLYAYDKQSGNRIPLEVAGSRRHKGTYLVTFKNKEHINEAEPFKGMELQVGADQLVELKDHEFYYHQIVDCKVFSEEGELLGTVSEILKPGANDVWVAKRPQGKDLLIPVIEDVVLRVDPEQKTIEIRLMEGMLDG